MLKDDKHQNDNPDSSDKKINKYPQKWDIPFENIATPERAGVFIGFKMYTALGYKPDDYTIWGDFSGEALLPALSSFYRRCQEENIPILKGRFG